LIYLLPQALADTRYARHHTTGRGTISREKIASHWAAASCSRYKERIHSVRREFFQVTYVTSQTDRPPPTAPADAQHQRDRMNILAGYVLLGGVVLSVLLIVAGLVWRWIKTGDPTVLYTIPKMNLFEFVTAEARDLLHAQFRPRMLVSLGITALLLTPYLRVLVSLLFFTFAERNGKYSLFTAFVLLVLTYSLFLRQPTYTQRSA
jgi:uncharacterized membrane protein